MLGLSHLKYLYSILIIVLGVLLGISVYFDRSVRESELHALATQAELASVKFKTEIAAGEFRRLSESFGIESRNLVVQILDSKKNVLFSSREQFVSNECAASSAIDGEWNLRLCRVDGPWRSFKNAMQQKIQILMAIGVILIGIILFLFIRTVKGSIRDSLVKIGQAMGKEDIVASMSLNALLKALAHQKQSIEEYRESVAASARFAAIGAVAAQFQHDVVNPLRVLRVALDDKSGNVDLQDAARNASNRVKAMIDDMKEFSGSLRVQVESIILGDTIDRAVAEAQVRHRHIQIEVAAPKDLLAHADAIALERVLINLIDNAVEASSPRVLIEAFDNENQSGVSIKISDWGIGISDDLKQRLVKPFASFGKKQGSGLGLWHASQVLKAMGGSMEILSHGQGMGAVVILHFQKG